MISASDDQTEKASGVPRRASGALALFGGTFDPVHVAHIRCAQAVSRALGHCPVRLLPNAVPPHRQQPGADGGHRLAMLELACGGHDELIADDWELRQGGASYTLATLRHFREVLGPDRPLVFMLGADSFADLPRWKQWRDYAPLCHMAVVPRPGAPAAPVEVEEAFPAAAAEQLLTRPAGLSLRLDSPRLDVSATSVRMALREKGHCRALIPAVEGYIRDHHLYNCR